MKGAGGKNSWALFSVVINRNRPWGFFIGMLAEVGAGT